MEMPMEWHRLQSVAIKYYAYHVEWNVFDISKEKKKR